MQNNHQSKGSEGAVNPGESAYGNHADSMLSHAGSDSVFNPPLESAMEETQNIYAQGEYYLQGDLSLAATDPLPSHGEYSQTYAQGYEQYPQTYAQYQEGYNQSYSQYPQGYSQDYAQGYSQYQQAYEQNYGQYQNNDATALYQPVLAAETEEPEKQKSNIGLVILALILTLLLIAGTVFGLYKFGFIGSNEENAKSINTAALSSEDTKDKNSKDDFALKDNTATPITAPTITSTPTATKIANLNEPDSAAEEVAPGVKRLNADATVPFAQAIALEVKARPFTPDESYDISVYSTVINKYFSLTCLAPGSTDGWVHCIGKDTKGDVQVWTKI